MSYFIPCESSPTKSQRSSIPFEYTALKGPDSFRVLEVQPAAFSDTLKCTMSVHSLSNVPAYEALSYAWGEKKGHSIDCDGKSLPIRENMCSALRRLRQPNTVRILWIDALCINQRDIEERNRQLRLMKTIYQSATKVLVWLGEDSADSPRAFELISRILSRQSTWKEQDSRMPMTAQDLIDEGLPEPFSPSWKSLDALYWRPWFTRIWVIQEISVAKEVTLMCGSHQRSWRDFKTVAALMHDRSLTSLTHVDPRRTIKLAGYASQQSKKGENEHLLRLLSKARDSYATDKRDKIYAMLGLALRKDEAGINPDYSKSVEYIYTSLAVYFIGKDRNLDILNAVESDGYRLASLPGWVPDWEIHPVALSFLSSPLFSKMQATKSTQAMVSFSPDGSVLTATGAAVDTISYIGDRFSEYIPLAGSVQDEHLFQYHKPVKPSFDSAFETFMGQRFYVRQRAYMRSRWRQWEKIAAKVNQYPTGEDTWTAFIRTLIANAELSAGATPDYHRFYQAWRQYWIMATRENGIYITKSHGQSSPADQLLAKEFMELHRQAAYGRQFFTSRNGYMGLGPGGTVHLGGIDTKCEIVILLGGRTPYILRKDGKHHHRFVGECYVHGLMNGEKLSQGGSRRTFAIR